MKKLLVVGIIILLVGMSVTSTGVSIEKSTTSYDGNTLYVGGDGPGNYTKIQNAINDSSEGDTVFVYNGTYYENVVLNKSIILIGENKDETIIDGSGKENGTLSIIADNVHVIGFTVQHSYYNFGLNGAILIWTNNVFINDNTIKDNIGAGFWLLGSSNSQITNNTVVNNTNSGINVYEYFECNENNIISNNTIFNNKGAGIRIYDSNEDIVKNNLIKDNNQSGIYLTGSSNISIFNNNFINNTDTNSEIDIRCSSDIVVSNNSIYSMNNKPNGGTGILLMLSENITIHKNNIYKNILGVVVGNSSYINITKNTIQDSGDVGIDVYSDSSNITIYNNLIKDNKYGIYLSNSNNNKIVINNFKNNKIHAFFVGCKNIWENNYWNRLRLLPKPIFGLRGWEGLKSYIIQFQFDWHPAKEPYDIGV